MKENIKISDAEWQVMKIIWEKPLVTSGEILEKLKTSVKWSPTTVYTLLTRLVNKGAIEIKAGSSPNQYHAIVSQKEIREEESRNFLGKIFDGSLKLMLSHMVEEQSISENEVKELMDILEQSRKKEK